MNTSRCNNGSFHLGCYHISCDATGSVVCKGSKVLTTEIISTFLTDLDHLARTGSFFESASQHRCFADMLIQTGGSCRHTHSLLHKQLCNLGLPSWKNIKHISDPRDVRTLHLFKFLNDGDPDQKAFKRLVTNETETNYGLLIVDGDCHCHLRRLITKDHLRLSDSFLEVHSDVPFRLFLLWQRSSMCGGTTSPS